jgi:ABC-type sulfate transport system permease component
MLFTFLAVAVALTVVFVPIIIAEAQGTYQRDEAMRAIRRRTPWR